MRCWLLALALALLPIAAWAITQIETSKINTYAVEQRIEIEVSKINTYAVLQTTAGTTKPRLVQ